MKRIIILTIFSLCASSLYSQNQIGITFMHNLSTFRFIDSEGAKLDLNYVTKNGYGFIYNQEISKLLSVNSSLYYDKRGASDLIDNQKLDWDFSYVGLNANLGLTIPIIKNLLASGGAGFYYARLITAEQYIGSQYYNIKDDGSINKNDIGFNIYGQINYQYSDFGSIFLRLNQSTGLLQLEKTNDTSQKMFNRTFAFQTGLLFKIK